MVDKVIILGISSGLGVAIAALDKTQRHVAYATKDDELDFPSPMGVIRAPRDPGCISGLQLNKQRFRKGK
jgi:hypothetical protein